MEIEDEINIERVVNNSIMVRFGNNNGDFFLDNGDRGSSNYDKSQSINGGPSASADSRGDLSSFSLPKSELFDDDNPTLDGRSDACLSYGLSYDHSKALIAKEGLVAFLILS